MTGYPPEDLLLRPGFVRAARESLERIAAETQGLVALVGVPLLDGDLYNACAICEDGKVAGWAKKWHLPNYGVFDEKRYFSPGSELARRRGGRHEGRDHDLRGHVGARASDDRARRGRCRAPRQPLGVSVPRRESAGA